MKREYGNRLIFRPQSVAVPATVFALGVFPATELRFGKAIKHWHPLYVNGCTHKPGDLPLHEDVLDAIHHSTIDGSFDIE